MPETWDPIGYFTDPEDGRKITIDRLSARPRIERVRKHTLETFTVDGAAARSREEAEAHLDKLEAASGRLLPFGSAAMAALIKGKGALQRITVGDDAGPPD